MQISPRTRRPTHETRQVKKNKFDIKLRGKLTRPAFNGPKREIDQNEPS